MDQLTTRLQEIIDLDASEKQRTEVVIHFRDPRPVPDFESLTIMPRVTEARFPAEALYRDGFDARFGYKDFLEDKGDQELRRMVFSFESKDVSVVETRERIVS